MFLQIQMDIQELLAVLFDSTQVCGYGMARGLLVGSHGADPQMCGGPCGRAIFSELRTNAVPFFDSRDSC